MVRGGGRVGVGGGVVKEAEGAEGVWVGGKNPPGEGGGDIWVVRLEGHKSM